MALELKKALRKKAYLKLGMSAPSGGGKTVGALLIAYGLMKEKYPKESDAFRWSKIAIIDTENGSGELYVGSEIGDTKIGQYNAITLTAPFEVQKYIQAIELCEEAGQEVCILDSTTHAWSGEGGLLEQQNNAAKRGGNTYTAWRDITPQHNRFVEKMLQTPMHVIATMRAKQEYALEKNEKGSNEVKKLGMEPEQRKGMEYEFTVFFEISADHSAFGAKDRTTLFDQRSFKITPKVGEDLMRWLEGGSEEKEEVVIRKLEQADKETILIESRNEIIELCKALGGQGNSDLMALLTKYHPSKNPNAITDEKKLADLKLELLAMANSVKTEEQVN